MHKIHRSEHLQKIISRDQTACVAVSKERRRRRKREVLKKKKKREEEAQFQTNIATAATFQNTAKPRIDVLSSLAHQKKKIGAIGATKPCTDALGS